MAIAANHHFMPAVIMLMLGLLIIALSLDFTVAQIGVDYGRNGRGLPPPSRVVQLYNQFNIRRMRIYDTDPETLRSLRGSNIELTVGIQNRDLQPLADNPANADAWVRDNIRNYPDVKFRHVVVGNEVRPGNPSTQQYAPLVLRAMRNIYNSVSRLQRGIKVTTAVDTEILDPPSSFPPQNGRFRPEVAPYLNPIVRFLVDTGAPLYANIYPYFAYINNRAQINLAYALLDPSYPGVDTPGGKYKNLFYALLDAVNAALEKSVASMTFELAADAVKPAPPEVVGGESGWSTRKKPPPPPRIADTKEPPKVKRGESGWAGHRHSPPSGIAASSTDIDAVGDDDVANIENARAYVNNLIQAVKRGTPRRPGKPIETYIFAMFDENMKPGNEEERHFGLFTPAGDPKYRVNFN